MKKTLAFWAVFAVVIAETRAASFTQGDLAILRYGDGTAVLNAGAAPIFIDEYTTAGAFVQSIAVSTNAGTRATGPGNSTSEGELTRSGNGLYLTFGAHDLALGGAFDSGSPAAVIGRVDAGGSVNTSTRLSISGSTNPPFNNDNFRSVYSPNGNQFYLAGNGGALNGGIQYVASLGASTSTNLSVTVRNTRVVQAFNGQLYLSTGSGTAGVWSVGSGIPTVAPQTATILPNNPFTSGANYSDFYFSTNGNTLITLNGAATFGLQVFTFSGSAWSRVASNTVLGTSLNLTAAEDGGNINIFYTTGNGIANTLTQTNSTLRMITWDGSAFVNDTQLAVAGVNQTFKGVDFVPVPEPSTALLIVVGLAGAAFLRRRR